MTLLSSFCVFEEKVSIAIGEKQVGCGQVNGRTVALVMVKSISPRCAPINVENFSQTPSNMPSLLFSARVCRKFFMVSPLSAPPICFCSSCTICDLSPGVRLGALRMSGSLGSFLNTSDRADRDLAVLSSAEVLAAAVYYAITVISPRTTRMGYLIQSSFLDLESITYQRTRVRSIKAKQCDGRLGVDRRGRLSISPQP